MADPGGSRANAFHLDAGEQGQMRALILGKRTHKGIQVLCALCCAHLPHGACETRDVDASAQGWGVGER